MGFAALHPSYGLELCCRELCESRLIDSYLLDKRHTNANFCRLQKVTERVPVN